MADAAQHILALWERVSDRLVFLEKHYVFRHGGLRLHPSELHLLLAIRGEPQANATRLAARLGITKGAVSQVMKRLKGKGVIAKHADPAQKNEVTVSFTGLGRKGLSAFVAERASTHKRFCAYLSALPEDEKKTLRRFLEQVGAYLPGNE